MTATASALVRAEYRYYLAGLFLYPLLVSGIFFIATLGLEDDIKAMSANGDGSWDRLFLAVIIPGASFIFYPAYAAVSLVPALILRHKYRHGNFSRDKDRVMLIFAIMAVPLGILPSLMVSIIYVAAINLLFFYGAKRTVLRWMSPCPA